MGANNEKINETAIYNINQNFEPYINNQIEIESHNFADSIINELDSTYLSIDEIIQTYYEHESDNKKNENINSEKIAIDNLIEEYIETLDYFTNKNNYNILVIGNKEVGKKKLIKSILNLPDEAQPTLYENNFELYTNKGYKIRFWRIDTNYDISKLYFYMNEINDFISEKINEFNPAHMIHAIWYCINEENFKNEEIQVINMLLSIYNDITLPVFIVHTKAADRIKGEQYIKKIEDKLKGNINYISLYAKDYDINLNQLSENPSFGLYKLVAQTGEKIANSTRSPLYIYIKESLKGFLVDDLGKHLDLLFKLTLQNNKINVERIDSIMIKLTKNIYETYFNNNNINPKIMEKIKEKIYKIDDLVKSRYYDFFNNVIEKYSNELVEFYKNSHKNNHKHFKEMALIEIRTKTVMQINQKVSTLVLENYFNRVNPFFYKNYEKLIQNERKKMLNTNIIKNKINRSFHKLIEE